MLKKEKNMSLENEFVKYEQALALKELGFNESCLAYFHGGKPIKFSLTDKIKNKSKIARVKRNNKNGYTVYLCTAPLYQQAFRWFREKYKLVNYIEYYAEWNFEIFRIDDKIAEVQDDVNVDYTFKGGTYEEAELECLKKLIELCKKT